MSSPEHRETELERKLKARLENEGVDPPGSSDDAERMLSTSEAGPGEPPVEFEEAGAGAEPLDPAEALEAEHRALEDQLLRARAEFDNYRKRTAREVDRIRKTAAESVIHDLLPVLDNLELALQHAEASSGPLGEGVRMVLRQMLEILERNGLQAIDAVGLPFDPKVHEAVSRVESDDVPNDHIAQEFQRGYTLGGQVIRPSKVVVSMGSNAESAQTDPK